MSVDITAVSKLKHSDLWEAARRLGGVSKLAAHLGIDKGSMYLYVALKAAPSFEKWTEERRNEIEQKLVALTGKTLDMIFPKELREATEFLRSPKQFEERKTFEAEALLTYASAARDRMQPPPPLALMENNELRSDIAKVMNTLSYREREIIKLRYGLGSDGESYSLDECAEIFKVTRERIRQLEAKGMHKLRKPQVVTELIEHLE